MDAPVCFFNLRGCSAISIKSAKITHMKFESPYTPKEESNPDFLKKKYGDLHVSPKVESASKRTEIREGVKTEKPTDKIQNYLDRFTEILRREDEDDRERGVEAFKKIMTDQLVIKSEDVPERVFILEQEIAEQQGQKVVITKEFKRQKVEQVQEDQRTSLEPWITYLASPDADYPDWAKYWAFKSMSQMGGYNKEKRSFDKRKSDTVAAFPTLNAGCLAETIGKLQKHLEINSLSKKDPLRLKKEQELMEILEGDKDSRNLLMSENFSKIYGNELEKFGGLTWENLENIRGAWKTYDQGSEPDELVESLKGYPLEWCTRNESTARNHLQGGDFHVYYSENNDGEAIVPRLAIRMQGENIGEIKGVEKRQHIDQYIQPVLDEKLEEYGSKGVEYLKKSEDMKMMTEVTRKHRHGEALSSEDLRFLYEIDDEIKAFGYGVDPRIEEVKEGRDQKNDLAPMFDCRPDQIALTQDEALSGDCVYYGGDLNLNSLTNAEGLVLPETMSGDLNLDSLTNAEGLILPKTMSGDLILDSLTNAEGLVLPETVGGYLNLRSLTNAEGLILPETMSGDLYLNGLKSAEGLVLPETVGGYLNLNGLKSAEGLILPKTMSGDLILESLTNAEGLVLPETMSGDLYLSRLTNAEGLTLPKTVGGGLILDSLTNAEGLVLPETMSGDLYLNGLKSAEGLILPKTMSGDLILDSLTNAEGLVLPETVGGYLNLDSLTNAEGLISPETVGGYLNLRSLTNAEGLILPETMSGDLYLNGLKSAEGLILPKTVGGYLNLRSLTNAEGLVLPETVGGYLNLRSLTNAEGLILPETMSRDLYLNGLKSAEGLILPKTVGGDLYLNSLSENEKDTLRKRYPQHAEKI